MAALFVTAKKLDTTQMSRNRRLDEQTEDRSHHGILRSNKKNAELMIQEPVNKSQKAGCGAEARPIESQGRPCDSICMEVSHGDRIQSNSSWGREMKGMGHVWAFWVNTFPILMGWGAQGCTHMYCAQAWTSLEAKDRIRLQGK